MKMSFINLFLFLPIPIDVAARPGNPDPKKGSLVLSCCCLRPVQFSIIIRPLALTSNDNDDDDNDDNRTRSSSSSSSNNSNSNNKVVIKIYEKKPREFDT